jgi:hypothetical protein
MSKAKSLDTRQKELKFLLDMRGGRKELEEPADQNATLNGHIRPPRTSAITFILVHERATGLIQG